MRTAIFGGTFDPVHTGHIRMAEYAAHNFALDRVILVPNASPPHKRGMVFAPYDARLEMLKIATAGKEFVAVSDYERGGSDNYSLFTMRHFRETLDGEVFFIVGADALITIHEWYEYKKLLAENRFIVFMRENSRAELLERVEKYRGGGADIEVAQMPEVDVSSTEIRRRIMLGLDTENLMDEAVRAYIDANGLYKGAENDVE